MHRDARMVFSDASLLTDFEKMAPHWRKRRWMHIEVL